MPILSTSTTLSLPAGQAFVFEAGSGAGTAVADPGGRNAKYSIGPQTTTVGPFPVAVSVGVTISSGTILYEIDEDGAVKTPAGIVISPDAPDDGDGRPVGTIYFQTA